MAVLSLLKIRRSFSVKNNYFFLIDFVCVMKGLNQVIDSFVHLLSLVNFC